MKKALSTFLISTLLFNLLAISFCSFLNNKFNVNNFIEQRYFNKKQFKKIQQRKIINFINKKKKQTLLNNQNFKNNVEIVSSINTKINNDQKSYCVFKKRWCGYWKIYICQQDWKKSLKIIDKIFSNGVKLAKLGKIIAVDLITLFSMQAQLIKVTITIVVAIILKLLEEGFTMICSVIESNKLAKQVIVKFWMAIPFWVSFR